MKPTKPKALKICDACGWYAHGALRACNPKIGELVSKLQATVRDRDALNGGELIKTTKLGYGEFNFVFETDDNFHVRFRMWDESRGFHVEDVWLLDSLDEEAAADLVLVLAAWRRRHLARKETPQPEFVEVPVGRCKPFCVLPRDVFTGTCAFCGQSCSQGEQPQIAPLGYAPERVGGR